MNIGTTGQWHQKYLIKSWSGFPILGRQAGPQTLGTQHDLIHKSYRVSHAQPFVFNNIMVTNQDKCPQWILFIQNAVMYSTIKLKTVAHVRLTCNKPYSHGITWRESNTNTNPIPINSSSLEVEGQVRGDKLDKFTVLTAEVTVIQVGSHSGRRKAANGIFTWLSHIIQTIYAKLESHTCMCGFLFRTTCRWRIRWNTYAFWAAGVPIYLNSVTRQMVSCTCTCVEFVLVGNGQSRHTFAHSLQQNCLQNCYHCCCCFILYSSVSQEKGVWRGCNWRKSPIEPFKWVQIKHLSILGIAWWLLW